MKRPTIERVHEVMKENGMKVFTSDFSMTLFAIRTKDNVSNTFNDWIGASYPLPSGGIQSVLFLGTTDAGLYYREHPMHVDGTAIIAHGKQYRGAFEYQNPAVNPSQLGHFKKEAFRQVGLMDYFRDPDRDKYLEFTNPEYNKNYYTNGHDMFGKVVGKNSAGCWGADPDRMDLLYIMALQQIEHGHGAKVSLAMLHEEMF